MLCIQYLKNLLFIQKIINLIAGSERSESSTYPETLSAADASEVAEEKREDSSDTDLSIEGE